MTVMLLSDHGFHPDHLRPRRIPLEPAGPAHEHRDFGVFVMSGPGIRKDEYLHGATVLDITPTILTLFDLPIGEDMDGRALVEAFEEPPEIRTIPSWDEVPGDDGRHAADTRLDPVASREAMHQLVALGYIEPPDENRERAVANTVDELRFNLARAYMDADRHTEAVPILQELCDGRGGDYRTGIQLAMCYRALGRIQDMGLLVHALAERRHRDASQARTQLKALLAEWRTRKQQRDPTRDHEPLMTDQERWQVNRLRALSHLPLYGLEYLASVVAAAEGRHEAALEHLVHAERAEPERLVCTSRSVKPIWGSSAGLRPRGRSRRPGRFDPDNPHAHLGLCRSHLARGRNRLAADSALRAVALLYHYPMAHFYLGVALARLGDVVRAVDALEVAVAFNPNFREARRRLARLYERRLHDPEKAAAHRDILQQMRAERGRPVRASV